jgi:uncharacterized protein YbjT (DUF2867 family)
MVAAPRSPFAESLGGTVSLTSVRVLVTGGSGRLAQVILSRPAAGAVSWRALSRRPAAAPGPPDWAVADLASGAGLDAALYGIDTVLHLASDPAHPDNDVLGTRQLLRAASAAHVKHLLYLSIVGVDTVPYRYYGAKLASEQLIAAGSVPWTILRAAQFHSFIDWLLQRTLWVPRLVVVPAGLQVQSVADEEVADRLVELASGPPLGRARDFAGPEILRAADVARTWRDVRRLRRWIAPVPVFGAVARALRAGANTAPDGDRGRVTWRQWLATRLAVPPK